MNFYLIALRLIHVFSGVLWAGASMALTWFVAPAVGAVGPDGGKVLRQLILRTRWVVIISAAAGLAILSGLLMYLYLYGAVWSDWVTTGPGIVFTIGGVAGILAGYFGGRIGSTSRKLAKLGERIASSGGPPSEQDGAEMGRLQAAMQSLGSTNSILLVIAVLAMASARYVSF